MFFTTFGFPLLLGAAMLISFPPEAEALLIASSSIEYCERGGVDSMPCQKKMVVTLTVESGQAAGAEEVVLIQEATDMTQNNGTAKVSFDPVTVTLSKTRVQYRYPIFYVRNFNARPYEAQVFTDVLTRCNDDLDPVKATCGVASDSLGNPIPYSQGFCCECSFCQLTGLCPPGSRGIIGCDVFGMVSSASCMRFGPLWYAGYSVGSGVPWYRVNLTLSTAESEKKTQNRTTATLVLGPEVISDYSPEFNATARLVGDFAPPEMPLVLSEKMFFVPASPVDNPRVKAGASEWMLLDRRLVSEQGRECNKVGVSYEAFASQGNMCKLESGSCLADQLEDYRASDLLREAAGGRGQYLVRFLGEFSLTDKTDTTSPYITYFMKGSLATMVVLTIAADNIQYVLSVSPGEIVSVTLSNTTLISNSKETNVTVVVRNTGAYMSQYTVGFSKCTVDLFPIPADPIYIGAKESVTREFNFYVQNATANQTAHCEVSLRNSKGVVIDAQLIQFNVKKVTWDNGPQGGGGTTPGGGVAVEEPRRSQGCKSCLWINVVCFLRNGCVWQSIVFAAVILGIVFLVYAAMKLFGPCCFSKQKVIKVRESASPDMIQ